MLYNFVMCKITHQDSVILLDKTGNIIPNDGVVALPPPAAFFFCVCNVTQKVQCKITLQVVVFWLRIKCNHNPIFLKQNYNCKITL